MNRKICLAACFLPFNEENSRWWLQFQTELDALGMDLVLLSAAASPDPQLKIIVVPLWLQGFRQVYGLAPQALTLEEPLAQTLASRDRLWSQQEHLGLDEFTAGLSVCQQVFRTFLNELQPSVVLVWSSGLPQSVVLQQLALQQGRPCWVLERGLLPGTLMLEMSGLGGHSELNWSYTVQQALRKSTRNGLFFAAQKAYKRNRTTKYAQTGTADPAAFQQQFNPAGRKIISLLLQHDAASALTPDDYLGSRLHAPGIPTSPAAIQALSAALAGAPGCRILVKPHPMDKDDYSQWENEHVTICRDINLHTLIEASDVVACMTSTTQFEALLFEKPVLLLARSSLAGKRIAYEGLTPGELPAALTAALARTDFKERLENGRRFIHFILENFSVSINSEAMPAGTTLADLAKFLAHNSVPVATPASLDQRLTVIGRQLSLWESLPKNTGPIPAPATPPSPALPAAPAARPPTRAVMSPAIFNATVTTPDSLKQVGWELCRKNCWYEASHIFNTLALNQPDDLEGWLGRITCARKQGQTALANLVLAEALERHAEWADRLSDPARSELVPA